MLPGEGHGFGNKGNDYLALNDNEGLPSTVGPEAPAEGVWALTATAYLAGLHHGYARAA